ncbi:MAG: hypothetical protein ACOYYS_17655 [Chloroflexota bacterium]
MFPGDKKPGANVGSKGTHRLIACVIGNGIGVGVMVGVSEGGASV